MIDKEDNKSTKKNRPHASFLALNNIDDMIYDEISFLRSSFPHEINQMMQHSPI